MFIISLCLGIIMGYIFKGKLANLAHLKLNYIWLVIIGVILEGGINALLQRQIWELGVLTYTLDLIMYILIFAFVILNRNSREIILMGIGFLLNALVIFANGGAMPVSTQALEWVGKLGDIADQGLYMMMHESTRFKLLADIIPISLNRIAFIISIGDVILCIGMIILVIRGMINEKEQET